MKNGDNRVTMAKDWIPQHGLIDSSHTKYTCTQRITIHINV